MIHIKSFVFNPFMENTYLLYDESGECIVIDPGCYENHEKTELMDFVTGEKLRVVGLWNTHCHIDHVLGNQFIKQQYDVKLGIHPEDKATLKAVEVYAPNYGFQNYEPASIDHYINEGDLVTFGSSELEVLFVPGHAPGHIAFVERAQKICIGGDVLFQRSIGRTDLPGGNLDTLIQSIHEKMFDLPDETVVYCGHGPSTTIGEEKAANPFCALKA